MASRATRITAIWIFFGGCFLECIFFVVLPMTPQNVTSNASLWLHTRWAQWCAVGFFVFLTLLSLAIFFSDSIARILWRKKEQRAIAISKQDANQEFYSFGNICDEIKAAKVISGTPNLGLPDDLSASLQCVHEAARQAAFLRWILIDPNIDTDGLQIIEKVLNKLLFTDVPAARKAFKPVEQKLILARESLKGDAPPLYNNKSFPTAHEAALRFAEDIVGGCGANSQELSFPVATRFQIIGRRLALLPRIDGQSISGEMKREAVVASRSNLGHLRSPINRDNPGRTFEVLCSQIENWRYGNTFTEYDFRRAHMRQHLTQETIPLLMIIMKDYSKPI